MSAHVCRSLVAIGVLATRLHAQNWESAPGFPDTTQPRPFAVGLELNGTLYAIGGPPWSSDGDENGSTHALHAGGTQWYPTAFLEDGPVLHVCAGVDSLGRIVVFGGYDAVNDGTGTCYAWEPVNGSFGSVAPRLNAAPDDNCACAADDSARLYSIGGGPGEFATNQQPNSAHVERYDATSNQWKAVASMQNAVADAAAVNDGRGHLLVIGGFTAVGGTRTANVAQYDVASNSWSDSAVADLPVALSGARAAPGVDGRIYVMGGSDGTVRPWTFALDLDANSWTQVADMATPRQHFGALLASDDYIYVLGGDNDAGGTALCEKLLTPRCPAITTQPVATTGWVGLTASFHAAATGAAPLDYQWRKDGIALSDGPSAGGGQYVGTRGEMLEIKQVAAADAGTFDVVIGNSCGSETSAAALLTVKTTPVLDAGWNVTVLHDPTRTWSKAHTVAGGRVGGMIYLPDPTGHFNDQPNPVEWPAIGGDYVNLVPSGSIGGEITDEHGDAAVGWYWWAYTTSAGTGYDAHACRWDRATGAFTDLQPAGYRFGYVTDTDGSQHVGWLLEDVTSFAATPILWTSAGSTILTPADATGGSCNGVENGRQFGAAFVNFEVHAAMWSGTPESFVDLQPPTAYWSTIFDARDGLQVGQINGPPNGHAAFWQGSADSNIDLHPAGATASSALGTAGGIEVGQYTPPNGLTHAAVWTGSSASLVDLHPFLPARYWASTAEEIEVADDGTITVTGYAVDRNTYTFEAVMWRQHERSLFEDRDHLSANAGGTCTFTLHAGQAKAGADYWLLGSYTGTTPGLDLKPTVHLPLDFDLWFALTLQLANTPILGNTRNTFDGWGNASATFNLPPGAVSLSGSVPLWFAYVVLEPGQGATFASEAVELVIDP